MWRYIKTQALVLLCGGLVGPIFLVVYFSSGQPQLMRWMFYTGLFVTSADVLVALALTSYGARSAATRAELERSGVLALAQITGIAETGTRVNNQPLVKLSLHIAGSGITAFDCQKRVLATVARSGIISAGKLVVLVDPATQEYRIDWQRSALVSGQMPAQFTVAEDNRTYDLSGQSGPLMEILRILRANGVALDRMIDIRSNPVLRQQVNAVVRRAAEAAGAAVGEPIATSAVPDTLPQPSIGERLQEVEALHRAGALTDEEYAGKRAQIIAEI